jgi:hypothetical protein
MSPAAHKTIEEVFRRNDHGDLQAYLDDSPRDVWEALEIIEDLRSDIRRLFGLYRGVEPRDPLGGDDFPPIFP